MIYADGSGAPAPTQGGVAGAFYPALARKNPPMEILSIVIQIMLPLLAVALGLQLMPEIGRWN